MKQIGHFGMHLGRGRISISCALVTTALMCGCANSSNHAVVSAERVAMERITPLPRQSTSPRVASSATMETQEAQGGLSRQTGTQTGAQRSAAQSAANQNNSVREITIVARNFEFVPSRIQVLPGQELRVTLTNTSRTPHNIEFELPDGEVELATPIAFSRTAMLHFRAPQEAGSYVFYCPVADHREHGMEGKLIVSPAANEHGDETTGRR